MLFKFEDDNILLVLIMSILYNFFMRMKIFMKIKGQIRPAVAAD